MPKLLLPPSPANQQVYVIVWQTATERQRETIIIYFVDLLLIGRHGTNVSSMFLRTDVEVDRRQAEWADIYTYRMIYTICKGGDRSAEARVVRADPPDLRCVHRVNQKL